MSSAVNISGSRQGLPLLKVNTPQFNEKDDPASFNPLVPSLVLSSSTPSTSEKPPVSPIWSQHSFKSSSRRNESRKLLAHILDQLRHRALPPSVFDNFKSGEATRSGKVIDVLMRRVHVKNDSKNLPVIGEDEEEEDISDIFTTDTTFELMMQLKEVLSMSAVQGWTVFEDGDSHVEDRKSRGKPSSPFRRSANVLSPGRRSRSPSPAGDNASQAPQLLHQCITIIATVVLEDCRFQISSPSPKRPPNALQAITLEVARFLLYIHRDNPNTVSQIAYALFPAFSTFPKSTHSRLLMFFEYSLVRGELNNLSYFQGVRKQSKDPVNRTNLSSAPIDTSMVSIRVDEVDNDFSVDAMGTSFNPWMPAGAPTTSLVSTNAPRQSLSVHQIASFIPPLLASILDAVEFTPEFQPQIEVLRGFQGLIELMVNSKKDMYLDLLSVIAYHSPKARYAAAALLTSYWGRSIGHLAISRPFVEFSREFARYESHPYPHQYVLWRFSRSGQDVIRHPPLCRTCCKSITSGLFCPFCACAVHLDCTNEGSSSKPALTTKFSSLIPDRRGRAHYVTHCQQHAFELVNLFTLVLCFHCHKPLWGCYTQGLKCQSCLQFAHSTCSANPSLSGCRGATYVVSEVEAIEMSDLRQSFRDYYPVISSLDKESVLLYGYEEISVLSAVLWNQLQLVENALSVGSLSVIQNGSPASDLRDCEFEVHRIFHWCEEILALNDSSFHLSLSLQDYLGENKYSPASHDMMFDWSNLVYLITSLKAPYLPQPSSPTSSPNLLSVNPGGSGLISEQMDTDKNWHAFESVSLAHMRDVLGYMFNIRSDIIAQLLLNHLHHLSFFDCEDLCPTLVLGESLAANRKDLTCTFPVPFGLDTSLDVETLFTAVESSLQDLDLSLNEFGCLLLIRRLWPNGMASEYALRRLARYVVFWVLAEDDSLATILRDYLAKGRVLPGVRHARDRNAWAQNEQARTASHSVNNGGDYVAERRFLLSTYLVPWLQALRDIDPANYGTMIYDLCLEYPVDPVSLDSMMDIRHPPKPQEQSAIFFDKVLRNIIRLSNNTVLFGTFDDLFVRWLDSVASSSLFLQPMPSLLKLFPREADPSQRNSMFDASMSSVESANSSIDPWGLISRVTSSGSAGLSRGLKWLCMFSRAGVDISVPIYQQFCSLLIKNNSSLSECRLVVQAILSTTWLKSMGRQNIHITLGNIHNHLFHNVSHNLNDQDHREEAIEFVRQTLGISLLLFGCDRAKIQEWGLILKDDISDLPSRRKLNTRGSMLSDPIVVHAGFMTMLEKYVELNDEEVSCMIALFLHSFITESSYLEVYEVDNFILRNGKMLTACAWHFYGIQSHKISNIRAPFFLRVVVVDAQPLQELLQICFRTGDDWGSRLMSTTRLFRIILDILSPAFSLDDRLWRSSIIDVFYYYYSAIWSDAQEEVRLAVETTSSTLLSAHHDAISRCWNEALTKSPIEDRIRIVSFLIHLQPHFSSWRLVSWEVIIECLKEDQYDSHEGFNASHRSTHLSYYGISHHENVASETDDKTGMSFGACLLLLSLRMISAGIPIDFNSLLILKEHLVRVIGFEDITLRPSASGQTFFVEFGSIPEISPQAIPCLHDLSTVLDSHLPLDLSFLGFSFQGQDGTTAPLLVGSPYVDILLGIINTVQDLLSLPVLTLKCLLESLGIVIYKHDFEKTLLRPLQQQLRKAVARTLDLALEDINYECRQVAFSVAQAYVKRLPNMMGSFVQSAIEVAGKLIAILGQTGQDPLVAQARQFLFNTLNTYASSGVFIGLFKRQLKNEFFIVLKSVTAEPGVDGPVFTGLRFSLLRDVLFKSGEIEQASFQVVLSNSQKYIETVCHQRFSAEAMLIMGQHMTSLVKRASDFSPETTDPTPILAIMAALIENNKSQSREILTALDTVLRVALVRMNVKSSIIQRLMSVTHSLYRKIQLPESGSSVGVVLIVFELLQDALRMKSRILPSTIIAMLEAITDAKSPGELSPATAHSTLFRWLAEPGIFFLQNHWWGDIHTELDLQASLATARTALIASKRDQRTLMHMFDALEKLSRHSMNIRAWNIVLLAALMNDDDSLINMLIPRLQAFSFAHQTVLRAYFQSGVSPPESVVTDINHTYIAIKLWLLLVNQKNDKSDAAEKSLIVWNELWPPFENLVVVFETEVQAGLSVTLAILTWTTVADLFLFVHGLRTPISLEVAAQVSILNRLKSLSRSEAHIGKLARTIRSLQDSPPDTSQDVMIDQIVKEIVATEKLRALEGHRRDNAR